MEKSNIFESSFSFGLFLDGCRLSIQEQEQVIMEEYEKGWAARAEQDPEDEIIKSGVSPDNIRKWKVLQSVQDRNETLFYR